MRAVQRTSELLLRAYVRDLFKAWLGVRRDAARCQRLVDRQRARVGARLCRRVRARAAAGDGLGPNTRVLVRHPH